MDAGIVDTFSPQEDEFASLLLGEETTYRAFIDPRRLDELSHLLTNWRSFSRASGNAAPLSGRWETFLRAVLISSPGRLLLKSPNHTFRLPWLAKRFPQAQFVWITRRRADLLESNRRMWSSMIERYGQWRLIPGALDAFLLKAFDNHDQILEWAREEISDRLTITTFEEAVNDTQRLVPKILERLGSDF